MKRNYFSVRILAQTWGRAEEKVLATAGPHSAELAASDDVRDKSNEVRAGKAVINEPRCAPGEKPLLRHACPVAAQGTQETAGQRALDVP